MTEVTLRNCGGFEIGYGERTVYYLPAFYPLQNPFTPYLGGLDTTQALLWVHLTPAGSKQRANCLASFML